MFGSDPDDAHSHSVPAGIVSPDYATTKTVEVCVNGVKQVIVIPQARSSDTVTTTATSTVYLQSQFSAPSLSSTIARVPANSVPDDVKLLAESCLREASSCVSSSVNPAVFSSVTNGHMPGHTSVSTGFASQNSVVSQMPALYQMFRMSQSCAPTGVTQNPHFPVVNLPYNRNRVENQATITSDTAPPRTLADIHSLSPPALRGYPFPPQQPNSTLSLPPLPCHPFFRTAGRNVPVPSQYSVQHVFSNTRQVPLMSQSMLQMAHMYEGSSAAAVQNYLHRDPAAAIPQLRSDSSLPHHHGSNYQLLPTFQDYFYRKRGVMPQHSAHGMQVNSGSSQMGYRVPQSGPHLFTGHDMTYSQRPFPVNSNEVQTPYRNLSLPRPVLHTHSDTSAAKKGGRRKAPAYTGFRNSDINNRLRSRLFESQKNILGAPQSQPLTSGISHCARPAVCNATASTNVAAFTLPNQAQRQQNSAGLNIMHPRPLPAVALTTSVAASSVTGEIERENTHFNGSLTSFQPVCVPNNLPVTMDHPVMGSEAFATTSTISVAASFVMAKIERESTHFNGSSSSFQPVCVPNNLPVTMAHPLRVSGAFATTSTETVFHPLAAMQSSSVSSAGRLTLDTLRFNTGSAASVPSNTSSTPSCSLSSLLTTDLFLRTSHALAHSGLAASCSDAARQTGQGVEVRSTLLGADTTGNLESLPADLMVENAESESLLMSFCNMFEQSTDERHPPSSMPAVSDAVKNSLYNGELLRNNVPCSEAAERGLQFAKSLGKGRHFAEQQREEQAGKKRRRTRLTSLEVADDSNSSESWRPGSQSESSEYQTPSSPNPSLSSLSQYSDDFVVDTKRAKKQRKATRGKQKLPLHHSVCSAPRRDRAVVYNLQRAASQQCSVMLERLNLQGRNSLSVHLVDSFVCCPHPQIGKRTKRVVSSDSECSAVDQQPAKKTRIKVPRIEDSESS